MVSITFYVKKKNKKQCAHRNYEKTSSHQEESQPEDSADGGMELDPQ